MSVIFILKKEWEHSYSLQYDPLKDKYENSNVRILH